MKRPTEFLMLLGVVIFFFGCAVVAPKGHDPVVVNAERTTTLALDARIAALKTQAHWQLNQPP
jgi:hypothetical protein